MFCDTHCHLYGQYYDDINLVINNAFENKVNRFIVDGCDGKSNVEVLEKVKEIPTMFGCLGIHPESVLEYSKEDLDFIEKHISDDKIIGIGEIGLDYHYGKEDKEAQQKLFRLQLELADKYHKPVVIHSRDATQDTINILKEFPNVKGVIHSFSMPIEVGREFIKMGYKLGINGVVTFKNSHLKDLLKEILPHIILETDSPYLTPHPYRGTKNESKYILVIAEFICNELNISLKELALITNNNIKEVFKI